MRLIFTTATTTAAATAATAAASAMTYSTELLYHSSNNYFLPILYDHTARIAVAQERNGGGKENSERVNER